MKPGSLAYKIFIDRFALKDLSRENLKVGDMVLVHTNPGSAIATVHSMLSNDFVEIVFEDGRVQKFHVDQVDKPVETYYDQCCARVSRATSKGDIVLAERLFETLSSQRFIPAGRILAGAGSGQNVTLANCYIIKAPKDSREGIYDSLKEWSELLSRGGGVGCNFSTLRPKGALVKGVNGRSSGSVSWMEMFSLAVKTIIQGGTRMGASINVLEIWHPDIVEFIHVKKDPNRLTGANISVGLSDSFMEAVKLDQDWQLLFPDTQFEKYNDDWDGDIQEWVAKGYPVIQYATYKAKDLWDQICEAAHASAEPGLFFLERCNKMSNSYYFNKLTAVNPCRLRESEVLTPEGIRRFEDIDVGSTIWSEDGWVTVTAKWSTGIKDTFKYITTVGHFVGTANHIVISKGERLEVQYAKTIDHLVGPKCDSVVINPQDVMDGLVIGDGSHHGIYVTLNIGDNDQEYFEVLEIKDLIKQTYSKNKSNRVVTTITAEELERTYNRKIPDRFYYGDNSKKCSFLRGLYSANGSVVGKRNSRVTLKQSSFDMIERTQQMLSSLGIFSYWTKNYGKVVTFGNGDYQCKDSYDLNISRYEDKLKFVELIGFVHSYKNDKLAEALKAEHRKGSYKTSFEVKEVLNMGEQEVFDITVDGRHHTYWSGSLNVSNCAEQPLADYSLCMLGHLNLPKFINEEYDQLPEHEVTNLEFIAKYIDLTLLKDTVYNAIELLDNCLDISFQPLEKVIERSKQERRIGMGTLGLGELLIRLGIRYGSEASIKLCDDLYCLIMEFAYMKSNMLAKEKGSFPTYDASKYFKSGFLKQHPNLAKLGSGIRNVCLLTSAPTGSVGTMLDTSTGIEPYYALVWERTSNIGKNIEQASVVKSFSEKYGIEVTPQNAKDVLPSYFVTAMGDSISVDAHINIQAVVQKYMDSSISKTINVPEHYTVDQVADAYMKLYDSGCKGGTVYRDNSRNEQVLRTIQEPTPIQEAVVVAETIKKRPRVRDAKVISVKTAMGTAHVTLTFDDKQPLEVFIDVGKGGSDIKALSEAFGRLISLLLRVPSSFSSQQRLEEVIKQLKDIGGARPLGFGKTKSKSLPDSIAKALEELSETVNIEELTEALAEPILGELELRDADLCPDCGNTSLVQQDGCEICIQCGFSQCG